MTRALPTLADVSPLARRRFLALGAASAAALALSSCGKGSGGGSKTFTIWHFEDKASAQYKAWEPALEAFKKKHPELDVKVVNTSFDSIRQNAKVLLGGSDVPDVVEVNKGSADAGQLAAQGLLENLDSQVASFGWDKIVTGAMQNLARYEKDGRAGSGS